MHQLGDYLSPYAGFFVYRCHYLHTLRASVVNDIQVTKIYPYLLVSSITCQCQTGLILTFSSLRHTCLVIFISLSYCWSPETTQGSIMDTLFNSAVARSHLALWWYAVAIVLLLGMCSIKPNWRVSSVLCKIQYCIAVSSDQCSFLSSKANIFLVYF